MKGAGETYPLDAIVLSAMQPGAAYTSSRLRFMLGAHYPSRRVERALKRMVRRGEVARTKAGTYMLRPKIVPLGAIISVTP